VLPPVDFASFNIIDVRPRWRRFGRTWDESINVGVSYTVKGEKDRESYKHFRVIKEGSEWNCLRGDRGYDDYLDDELRCTVSKEIQVKRKKTSDAAADVLSTLAKEVKAGKYETAAQALEAEDRAVRDLNEPLFKESVKGKSDEKPKKK
jgi:hypothetical protein